MEKVFDDYLEKLEKYLRPIAISERVDIINEIKSQIQELQNNGVSAEEIIERLGNPKDLAKAYLGNLLAQERKFSWNRFLTICAFYSLTGLSGMFVIPCLGVIAPTFIVSGVIAPVLCAVKMIDYIFSLHIPYMQHIGIYAGEAIQLNPIIEFIISIVIGVLLYWLGQGAWKLLVLYCNKISKTAKKLSV